MAADEPGDVVVLELNQLALDEGDTLTLQGTKHFVVSRAPDRRQLVLREGTARKAKKAADGEDA